MASHLRHVKEKVMQFRPPGHHAAEVYRLAAFLDVIWGPACWGVVRPRGPFADQKRRKTLDSEITSHENAQSHKAGRRLSDNPKLDSIRPVALNPLRIGPPLFKAQRLFLEDVCLLI